MSRRRHSSTSQRQVYISNISQLSKMSTLLANTQITAFVLLISWNLVSCNPLPYDGLTVPIYAISSVPMPMMMAAPHPAHQYDPYAAMSVPAQYMMAPPMNMAAQPRRSSSGREKPPSDNESKSDEQKALDGLPVSFIEPEPPSSISERISDSFSAIGEGVRNHFRSLTENFSDTMDDIKDAWRFPDNRKRG